MDLTRQRFGKLFVLCRAGSKGKTALWKCRCDCGVITTCRSHHLTQLGGIRSCGCLKKSKKQKNKIICKKCKLLLPIKEFFKKDSQTETRHNICKKCMKPIYCEARKKRNIRDKKNALEKYGGIPPKCACCGECHLEFLTIDHMNGGGNVHRKEIGGGSGGIYRWLRNKKWPDGFRVLCINCNYSIGLFGYCPHQKEEENEPRQNS